MRRKSIAGKYVPCDPSFIKTGLLIVATLFANLPAARADYLYFWDETQARQMATKMNPGASEDRIEKALSEYRNFIDALSAKSLYHEPYQNRPFFHVNMVDYIPGLRLNPMDASHYDRFALRAMGPGGVDVGPEEIFVSTIWMRGVVHQFDTPKDFEWYISDHHMAGNVAFGSEAHRKIIYRLVDPDGFSGLPEGAGAVPQGEINHGRITKYLLTGFPSQMEFFTSNHWSMNSPRANRSLLTVDETVNVDRVSEALSVNSLILATALAEKYSAFDPTVGKMAKEAIGLICTLSLSDPDMAADEKIRIAERASYLGQACRRQLHLHLWTYAARNKPNLGGEQTNMFQYYDDSALPIDGIYALNPILDVMLKENVFRSYPGVLGNTNSEGEFEVIINSGPVARNTVAVMEILAEIAFEKKAAADIEDIRPKALAVIERMAFPLDGDGAAEREKYKVAQMAYQEVLWRWTWRDDMDDRAAKISGWYFPLMCRNGWGSKKTALALAEARNYTAGSLISQDIDGELEPGGRQQINDAVMHLVAMRRLSGSDNPAHVALSERIEKFVEEYRETARYYGEEDNVGKRFLAIYQAHIETDLNCQQNNSEIRP